MTFKVIRGQGQGEEMTSVPYQDYFYLWIHLVTFWDDCTPPFFLCPVLCFLHIPPWSPSFLRPHAKLQPRGFLQFFPQRLRILTKMLHVLCVHGYAKLQDFIQLSLTLRKLYAILSLSETVWWMFTFHYILTFSCAYFLCTHFEQMMSLCCRNNRNWDTFIYITTVVCFYFATIASAPNSCFTQYLHSKLVTVRYFYLLLTAIQ